MKGACDGGSVEKVPDRLPSCGRKIKVSKGDDKLPLTVLVLTDSSTEKVVDDNNNEKIFEDRSAGSVPGLPGEQFGVSEFVKFDRRLQIS